MMVELALQLLLGYRSYDKNGKELPACGQTLLEFESVSDSELYRIPEDVKTAF